MLFSVEFEVEKACIPIESVLSYNEYVHAWQPCITGLQSKLMMVYNVFKGKVRLGFFCEIWMLYIKLQLAYLCTYMWQMSFHACLNFNFFIYNVYLL